MAYEKTHEDCPACGHKKCLTINTDGTAWCHSCTKYYKNYEEEEDTVEPSKPTLIKDNSNPNDGGFNPLTDRSINLDTAKKYGVKSVINSEGRILKHFYPYFNGAEEVAFKTRVVNSKGFLSSGPIQECGLFGQQ